MSASTTILVLAQNQGRLNTAADTLRDEPGHHLKTVLLPELHETLSGGGRSRLSRLFRGAQGRPTVHDHLVASCRDLGADVVVAADQESAKVAHRLVGDVPHLLAVMGADSALRVLARQTVTGELPGGSADDVFGRTRFVPGADTLPPVSPAAASRLVIGPDNRDGRAGAWALLCSTPSRQAYACQVVDGTDFFSAPADLSISRGEWNDERLARRFAHAVTTGTTHVLATGAGALLPAGSRWPDHVRTGVVLDVVDLVPSELIDEAAAQVPVADPAAVSTWQQRARKAADLVSRAAGSVFVTDSGLPGAVAQLPVLPLVSPRLQRVGGGGATGPPLVVTGRPEIDLGSDPAAEVAAAMAAAGRLRHVSLTDLPPSLWVSAIKAADVVVDRVWLPGMGMAAAIALSTGVPVITGTLAVAAEAPVARASLATLPDVLAATIEGPLDDSTARTAFAEQRREQARLAIDRFARS